MIDFASIKTTPSGEPCHYFGMRLEQEGCGMHCFGVWTAYGVFERCYNDAGQQLTFRSGKWLVDLRFDPIVPPLKRKVWAYYVNDDHSRGFWLSNLGPDHHDTYDDCQEVEVP